MVQRDLTLIFLIGKEIRITLLSDLAISRCDFPSLTDVKYLYYQAVLTSIPTHTINQIYEINKRLTTVFQRIGL